MLATAVCFAVIYLRRDPWSGLPAGVYVTQAVDTGIHITPDLLREVGPAGQSAADNAPKSLDELGAQKNCLIFEKPLKTRQRIHWDDVGFCTSR